MALSELSTDLQKMSRSASKLVSKLGEFAGNIDMLRDRIASGIAEEGVDILLDELSKALNLTPEYDFPLFRPQLEMAFSNPDMIKVDKAGVRIMPQAHILAGSWSELKSGVKAAQEALASDERMQLTQAKALEFWTHRVYRPAREGLQLSRRFKKNKGFYRGAGRGERIPFDYQGYAANIYSKTIAVRQSFWGDKAPYWLWLNFGNTQEGAAYPENAPTHFVEHAERRINQLLEQRTVEITREFSEAVTREVEAFLTNPDAYQAGQELDRFMFQGTEFRLGVGEGGELSVRRVG